MTKIEAITKVMEDNGGTASLQMIYQEIGKYYPSIKSSSEWEAGIRGVLYREVQNKRRFKKIGLSIYALDSYTEKDKPIPNDCIRMHSYIEGICIELGNYNEYLTYTADPSAHYRDNIVLKDIATLPIIPDFTYPQIIKEARRIDVLWFNKRGLKFPKYVFEVVDSINTMNGAFNRSIQLSNFLTHFTIVAPEQHREKFRQTIDLEVYQHRRDRFSFINYDEITELYESTVKKSQLEKRIFKNFGI